MKPLSHDNVLSGHKHVACLLSTNFLKKLPSTVNPLEAYIMSYKLFKM